ncbi:MAG: pyruvate:ferredoxin (flavodoxin) oxidoreductase [Prevotella sp.]|jgi:pyruvate-ferredoxin/flavodoxin oxidoreductase|nr:MULTISPECIES: pyruvate:ferredoxin (flavodoxin) oxidoreductase [unclassified Prevotella]MCH3969186.1 pyruvate:ferredoxin (flavodoxin) oxidoreductase [Prevotella sp.]MCH3985791.1 pyruvate:ferredoxin (flavodoxin) oxidoreductase [Prevotella sp.]MCH3991969.1 pyruvate:ferredoxin (flavodoxin) oxidoreductase [Prevotella sp.]MCH4017464.1 pyruvate:ferredoxin (flavodoxin) oxidoreductase [Prevotella sp.]MCH4185217.1 pyruvate:ferredoxin (flavodoxin) oxidoreductase [Prevotella sp.]
MAKEKKFITCDGNTAAAHVSYMFTEVAAIYPITPSSPMAEHVDEWAAKGRKNLFGQTVTVQEMESEGGAAGAVHGSLQAGALTTTFTASQGLLLMIPNMYKIAGELLPAVFDVAARSVATHALSIFGDQSDVMACRQTGFAIFCSGSVQEVMDLTAVPHLSTLKTSVPFINFFDGFRTSHEYHKIEEIDQDALAKLVDPADIKHFRDRALSPERPVTRGTAENPETFFTHREACNSYYDKVPGVVEHYLGEISKITGREYHLFNYYGAQDAENIIILMGSASEPAREAIDYLNKQGKKVGMVSVHLFRPFSVDFLRKAIPATVKRIAVLDRTKEPGAEGEPLYLDVKSALYEDPRKPVIVGGRYGLSSADTTPADIISVFNNLEMPEPKNHFTVGIVDDVTFTSLPKVPEIPMGGDSVFEAKFYGLGADGTVGANKNSVQIIGNNTNKYCQAYFSYDSKKSGGFTCSHLRFGDDPIHSSYQVNTPNFVACHVQAYLYMYDVTRGLRKNGTFLLNTIFEGDELVNFIPNKVKRYFAKNNIKVYYINATKIAHEIGLGNRTNTILQSAFFRITKVIPLDLAVNQMKAFIVKSYSRKGQDVVDKNYQAVDRGDEYKELTVDPAWANLKDEAKKEDDAPAFVKELVRPINAQAGDLLKVSDFFKNGTTDGTWQNGTSAYEKRGVEAFVPVWNSENCIQCNKCAFACPHAAIRPFVMDDEEVKGCKGDTIPILAPQAIKGMHFRQEISVMDCLGCGNCVDICPGKKGNKALSMVPFRTDDPKMVAEAQNWDWLVKNVSSKQNLIDIKSNPRNSQFATPLFEFSGACAGCGETPYVKLVSQLFGDREMIANATGCSSIYSASIPATPYTTNAKGQGPAFDNSLFEDFSEFGLGMVLANKKMKERITMLLNELMEKDSTSADFKAAAQKWIENKEDADGSKAAAAELKPLIEKGAQEGCPICTELKTLEHYLVKRSQWLIGGDGASYDIDYGGLDHVLSTGEDVNVLVMDTEVYSNTGGQSSKATPLGAIAQFAAQGKRVRKKDLGLMETTYGYIYVAQIAMGANNNQTLKAIREAEAYHGPSLIIAYSPCINHGLKRKGGMGKSQREEALAVECGYWHLWRYNPELAMEGKNPFQLDSKEPEWDKFRDFLLGEVRYLSVKKAYPNEAEELYAACERMAKIRYQSYVRKSKEDWSDSLEQENK